ncbi:hypothetical protein CK203_049353 [Vitis vinifera]|uniref:Uncharacterized protein n=1 Tax=Vitis vinifera TaxID=29760 RepID=A0A438FVN1_VITVI|nr:hypothetical protein CK203_049353 [Vitis vinifera]
MSRINFSSPNCYARFWSTWDTHLSLSLSTDAFVERYSLLTNGRPEEPQPVQIPADMRAPAPVVPFTEPIPEVAPSAPPATPRTPPIIPSISKPSSSSEPRIVISIFEYKGLCHTLQALTTSQSILTQQMTALRAHQEQIIAT